MNRKAAISMALMAVWVLVLAQAGARAAQARQSLKVKLRYTGAETVDAHHRIYVLLFDADPYTVKNLVDSTSDPTPPAPAPGVCHMLGIQSTSRSGGTVTFQNLAAPTVYVMAFVDKAGTYDGHAQFPHYAPMGIYGKPPNQLEPISLAEGKTQQIVIRFDDTYQTR